VSAGETAAGTRLEVQAAPGAGGIAIASLVELGGAPLAEGTAGGGGWRLLGQDGGQTIDLGDEVLFTFADTLIQPVAEHGGGDLAGQVLLANCAARAQPGAGGLPRALAELRYLEDARGWPRQILAPTAEERRRRMRLWPAHGLAVDGRVYLFYLGIEFTNPSSDWGFRNLGAGLAALDPATGEAVRVRTHPHGDWCLWRAHGDDFHFGVQVLREGDLAYVYSSVRHGYFSEAGVARVPVERIGEPAAYTFLAAGGWSPRHAEAASLGPASNDYSVSWNAHLGRYLMTFVDPYAKVLYLRTAQHPWGPWSEPQPVAALPNRPGSELIFLGFEHPRFAADGGRTVYITYCQPHFVQNTVLALTFG
jgi:hypothetical protein